MNQTIPDRTAETHTQSVIRNETPEVLVNAFRKSFEAVFTLCSGVFLKGAEKRNAPLYRNDLPDVQNQIRLVSGQDPSMLASSTARDILDFIHRGAGAAWASFDTENRPKRKTALKKLVTLGYDTIQVTGIAFKKHCAAVGRFAGAMLASFIGQGRVLRDRAAAGMAIAGMAFLLTASSPALASDGIAPTQGENPLTAAYVNERLAALSSGMESSHQTASGIALVEQSARTAASEILASNADRDSGLRQSVNRLAVDRDMATVRLLAAVAEKSPEKRKIHLLRFERDGFSLADIADRMRRDSEVLRLFCLAAGIRNPGGEKAVREIFRVLGTEAPPKGKKAAEIHRLSLGQG